MKPVFRMQADMPLERDSGAGFNELLCSQSNLDSRSHFNDAVGGDIEEFRGIDGILG